MSRILSLLLSPGTTPSAEGKGKLITDESPRVPLQPSSLEVDSVLTSDKSQTFARLKGIDGKISASDVFLSVFPLLDKIAATELRTSFHVISSHLISFHHWKFQKFQDE
ncbi:hypothetical protein BKA65DRAFT_556093 [Rhexocercosporidium sp. MPI-PUGE-AT-0058]|nr:hypothetical protein BKA65DRAFT_556093 [Rhexocercosporidium sp. MPI-PUGE-AT-0058]